MNGTSLIKRGQVISVNDTTDGLRVKVRLPEDGSKPADSIDWSFPLLPKSFMSAPKVGEGVFVILSMSDNQSSQRYYIGPIISQPQDNSYADWDYGRGGAATGLKGAVFSPKERVSNTPETIGSFPTIDDVAVVGRGSQDIILREDKTRGSDEIDIRCGIRSDAQKGMKNGLQGKVMFNDEDPAYIQLKYRKGLTKEPEQEANGIINLVADKLNLISHQDENGFNLTDPKQLIREDELDELMSKLHQLPHGDTLLKLLKLMIDSIITHVHPYAAMPAVISDSTAQMIAFPLETILSKHVRIS